MHPVASVAFLQIRFVALSLGLVALFVASGCSISKSSESISNSISSPFASSSDSFKSDETKYREEVAEYAQAFVSAGGDAESFQKGVAKLAARRGISDWESNPNTWTQVGRALGKTDLTEAQALAYAQAWSSGDEFRFELIRKAFVDVR